MELSDEKLVEPLPGGIRVRVHLSADGLDTWIVSRAVREDWLTVALSRLSGDELFGGYPSFRRLRLLARAAPLLRAVPRLAGRALGRMVDALRGAGGGGGKLADRMSADGSVAEAYPVPRRLFVSDRVEALTGGSGPTPHARVTERLRDGVTEGASTGHAPGCS